MTETMTEPRPATTVLEPSRSVDPETHRRLPWFGVGRDLSKVTTAAEAIRQAGLDWDVTLEPLYRRAKGAKSHVRVPHRFATVRTDTDACIGTVGRDYVPFMNRDAFTFMDSLVADGLAEYWSAGEMRDGRQVFVVVKLAAELELVDGAGDLFLLLRTSHDGSRAIQAVVTPIQAWCTNQTALIMSTAPMKWAVQHYSTAHARLEQARNTLARVDTYAQELQEVSKKLASFDIEIDTMERILKDVLPERPRTPILIQEITQTWQHSRAVDDELRPTAWGALSAVTETLDHRRPSRSHEARFMSIQDGAGARVRNAVAHRLLEMAR